MAYCGLGLEDLTSGALPCDAVCAVRAPSRPVAHSQSESESALTHVLAFPDLVLVCCAALLGCSAGGCGGGMRKNWQRPGLCAEAAPAAKREGRSRASNLFKRMVEGNSLLDSDVVSRWPTIPGQGWASRKHPSQTIMESSAARSGRSPRGAWKSHFRGRTGLQPAVPVLADQAALSAICPGFPGQLFVFSRRHPSSTGEHPKGICGHVSHEIATPAFAHQRIRPDAAGRAMDDPEQAARFLQKIDKHSDRMLFSHRGVCWRFCK